VLSSDVLEICCRIGPYTCRQRGGGSTHHRWADCGTIPGRLLLLDELPERALGQRLAR
jgi:hypothetical protein